MPECSLKPETALAVIYFIWFVMGVFYALTTLGTTVVRWRVFFTRGILALLALSYAILAPEPQGDFVTVLRVVAGIFWIAIAFVLVRRVTQYFKENGKW